MEQAKKQDTEPCAGTFTVTVPVSAERIANLMISFIESGDPVTRGWCREVKAGPHSLRAWRRLGPPADELWYADPKFWALPDWKVAVCEDDNTAAGKRHEISPAEFNAGLSLLAGGRYADHFKDLITDNADAATADIFMQMVVFGQETYA